MSTTAQAVDYTALNPVVRIKTYMDNGTWVYVDNASRMTTSEVQNLVLAADRSTKSGCPYTFATKGLISNGDRVFVSDYYIAWFDYTLNDGVGSTRWARSGALAGFWSLDPNIRAFKYFLEPSSASRETPNADGTCWNWPRNQLIAGSNSPKGQSYWWDTHAPAVENTIVVKLPPNLVDPNSLYGDINLFSTIYTQGTAAAGFNMGSDGWQNSAGVHYTTAGKMTSWNGDTSFTAINAAGQVTSGQINYVLDFNCNEKEIQVVWLFTPTATLTPVNYYSDLWVGYSGLGRTKTCAGQPVPPTIYGTTAVPGTPYHSLNYVRTSQPFSVSDHTGTLHSYVANATAAFPWSEAVPCNQVGGANGFNVGSTISPVLPGLPLGATLDLGFASDLNPSKPFLRMINRLPPVSGTGTSSDPKALPYRQMISGFENTDQQQSMLFVSANSGQVMTGGLQYINTYSITSQP